ncbi:MAG: bifunctional riboflavin kinase/FAD synthetase [Pseudomonadota bacterium]
MKVHRSYKSLPEAARGCSVAIGNFDGVHRGHKALIEAARTQADAMGAPLGIITFEPHPLQLLRPEIAPKRLTPFRTKIKVLASLGVDHVYALTFNQALREQSPEAFVREVLVDGLGIRHAVVGYDFRFGHKASGDTATLVNLGKLHGFGVTRVDPISWHGEICSSSRARALVAAGEVAGVADLLGHRFIIEGHVVDGDKRGRDLGYPTANIRPPKTTSPYGPAVWPVAGVYAVRTAWQDGAETVIADGVANIGQRPTFDDHQGRLLEVHLFDRSDDLYGKRLCTEFVAHLRDELPFADVEALKEAMAKDCADARAALAASPLGNEPLHAYLTS